MNNLPPKTIVTGSSRNRRTVLQVNYSASMDQVMHLNTLSIESVLSANKAKVVLYLGLEAKKSFFFLNEKEYIMRWKKGFGFVWIVALRLWASPLVHIMNDENREDFFTDYC